MASDPHPHRPTPGRSGPALLVAAVLLTALSGGLLVARNTPNVLLVAGLVALVLPGLPPLSRAVASLALRRRADDLGVTYRDAYALRTAGRVDAVVLCDSALLTTGEREVAAVHPLDPAHERSLRWFGGALAHGGDDPVLRAVARLAAHSRVTGVQAEADLGLSGAVDRHPVRVGRPDWLGMDPCDHEAVGVEVDGRPLGTIAVRPVVVASAEAWLREARRRGIETYLSPTDHAPDHAPDLAARLPVGLLDACPAVEVSRLRAEGRTVAVASDGTATTAGGTSPVDAAHLDVRRGETGEMPEAAIGLRGGDVTTLLAALLLPRSLPRAVHRGTLAGLAPVLVGPSLALGWLPVGAAPLAVVVGAGAATVLAWRGVGLRG